MKPFLHSDNGITGLKVQFLSHIISYHAGVTIGRQAPTPRSRPREGLPGLRGHAHATAQLMRITEKMTACKEGLLQKQAACQCMFSVCVCLESVFFYLKTECTLVCAVFCYVGLSLSFLF